MKGRKITILAAVLVGVMFLMAARMEAEETVTGMTTVGGPSRGQGQTEPVTGGAGETGEGVWVASLSPEEGDGAEPAETTETYVWWDWSGTIAIPDGPDGAWVGVNCNTPTGIPAGSQVTKVEVHHEITHTYIGDLQVQVYNSTHTWALRTNEGGSVDNINETLTELSLFDGDDPVQPWYYRVRDTLSADTGTLDVMQLYVYYNEGGAGEVDLAPYQPTGWSAPVVVSNVTGTTTDSLPLCTTDTLYVDWAAINNGTAAAGVTFYTQLYLDGSLQTTWSTPPEQTEPGTWFYVGDYAIGSLSAGPHTLDLVVDYSGLVAESNENNNIYTKYIQVIVCVNEPDIRIAPTVLDFDCTGGGAASAEVVSADNPWVAAAQAGRVRREGREKLLDASTIDARLAAQGKAHVIVNLEPPLATLAGTNWRSREAREALRQAVAAVQGPALAALAAGEFELEYMYENQAGFSGYVTVGGLQKLMDDAAVETITPVRILQAHTAQGIPLMNALAERGTYNGQNMAIAICDTGIDYTHTRLGGGGFPNSKVLGGYDFGDGDSNPMPVDEAHGTSCAGIAAGDLGTVGDYIGGVAYGAKLYALKIAPDSSGSATEAAMIAAWDWCVTHQNDNPTYPIMVISTSFGGGQYFSACDGDSPGMTAAAMNANAAGMTVLASSGNDGFCDSMGWPACISYVISVGAVYDAAIGATGFCVDPASCGGVSEPLCTTTNWACFDTPMWDMVTCYSNTASFLDILAPSNDAYTTDIAGSTGYSTGDYTDSFGGTSAACPYAAGAVACLQSAAKALTGNYLTPAQVRSTLSNTGDNIMDGKVAITKPRVNLAAAITSLGGGCEGELLTIYNDGGSSLSVSSISRPAWVTLTPAPPYSIGAGSNLGVCVEVDCQAACAGGANVSEVLAVYSDDPDENPYPGGVTVNVGCVNCAVRPLGDLNDDCRCNMADLALFAGSWLECGLAPAALCD